MTEEFVNSFKKKLESRGQRRFETDYPTIHTESILYGVAGGHRQPRYVSIGPLHHGNSKLARMENHKWWLMCIFKFGSLSFEKLSTCFLALKREEERFWKTYSRFGLRSALNIIEVIFVDACFICLRLIVAQVKAMGNLITIEGRQRDCANLLPPTKIIELIKTHEFFNFGKQWLLDDEIRVDLIAIDNQIPFFVLEIVWNWLVEAFDMPPLDIFGYLRFYFDLPRECRLPEKTHHLLQLFHWFMCSKNQELFMKEGRINWIPSATDLKEAGVKFKSADPYPFVEIEFRDGVVSIPRIPITERLRLEMENLIDYERSVSFYRFDKDITKYVRFMSCLLAKEDDARIMTLEGIIDNQIGSDEDVRQFFHNLLRRCPSWKIHSFLSTVFIEINSYQQSKRRASKASFLRRYCNNNNPLVTLSVIGAIILFILTFPPFSLLLPFNNLSS